MAYMLTYRCILQHLCGVLFVMFFFCGATSAFALSEVELPITFRGEGKSIALMPVKIHIASELPQQGQELMAQLHSLLLDAVIQVSAKEEADIHIVVEKSAPTLTFSLQSKDALLQNKKYILPQDTNNLQNNILGYAQLLGIQSLQNDTNFSGVLWKVQTWIPAKVGEENIRTIMGEFWKPATLFEGSAVESVQSYEGRVLLSFSFVNSTKDTFYAYLINSTEQGQITPILAPTALANAKNTLTVGKVLQVEDVYLELSSQQEVVHVILSQEPLNFSHWQQESYESATSNFMQAQIAPSQRSWSTRKMIFMKNN